MNRAAILVWPLALAIPACAFEELEPGTDDFEVIGGDPTPEGLYPATGALMAGGQPSCTGTLIAPDVVLTAAHCVDDLFLGGEIPSFTLALDANVAVESEIVAGESKLGHPQFDLMGDPGTGVGQWYDIGLLHLAEPITSVDHAILPSPTEASGGLVEGMNVEIVGYGLTSTDAFDVGVKHHGSADLVEVGGYELFIAEPGQQQNCNGDSGGPAFVDIGGEQRLVGVVSRSPDQNPVCDHGGIDTRVDPYLDWIHANADLPCGTGLSEPCEPIEPDAGPTDSDGGFGGDDDDGGGCCSVAGDEPAGSALLGVLVLAALVRRRRR